MVQRLLDVKRDNKISMRKDESVQTLLFVGPCVKYVYPHLEVLAHVHIHMNSLARSSSKRTHSRAL